MGICVKYWESNPRELQICKGSIGSQWPQMNGIQVIRCYLATLTNSHIMPAWDSFQSVQVCKQQQCASQLVSFPCRRLLRLLDHISNLWTVPTLLHTVQRSRMHTGNGLTKRLQPTQLARHSKQLICILFCPGAPCMGTYTAHLILTTR